MNTSKAISTISFNTRGFLVGRLNDLVQTGKLSFWAAIEHKGEDDEAGKKNHFHIYAEPSKRLQTDVLRASLVEPLPDTDKPLGALPWRSSVFSDWYMYVKHDKAYLLSKGKERKYHYSHEDFFSSESDYLLCLAREISLLDVSPYKEMESCVKQGIPWPDFFRRGTVPVQLVRQYKIAYEILQSTIGTDMDNR